MELLVENVNCKIRVIFRIFANVKESTVNIYQKLFIQYCGTGMSHQIALK